MGAFLSAKKLFSRAILVPLIFILFSSNYASGNIAPNIKNAFFSSNLIATGANYYIGDLIKDENLPEYLSNSPYAKEGIIKNDLPPLFTLNPNLGLYPLKNTRITKSYPLKIKSITSSIATLNNLTVSSGTLSPVFAINTFFYNNNVTNNTSSITVTPTLTDNTATVTVNGTIVNSGTASTPLPLVVGNNIITILVTAVDGITQNAYTVTVNRAQSTTATLSGLGVSSGTLSPSFSSAITSYNDFVTYTTNTIKLTPTLSDATASVTVNGNPVTSGTASSPFGLVNGLNTFTIVVTAQDGITSQTYYVNVNHPSLPSVTTLSSLSVSNGNISPSFASGTSNYIDYITNSISSITVTPTLTDPLATFTINGIPGTSGTASNPITLSIGSNPITMVVTAQDGITKQTYNLNVNVAPSGSTYLSDLVVSTGTLSPAFAAGTTNYNETVPNSTSSITFIPTLNDPNSTVTVNGSTVVSGATSQAIALTAGANPVSIVVTDQSLNTKTYTVTVTRAASSINTLNSISLSSGSLSPTFNSGTISYTASVTNAISSITVTPTVTDANAKVTVNGVMVNSGTASSPISLGIGSNTVIAIVTAQDGSTKTYTLTINRAASTVSTLSSLVVSSGTLSPVFAGGTTSYTDNVANAPGFIVLTPTLTDPSASVTVNGITVASGSPSSAVILTVGNNIINTVVTAQDGSTKTYSLTVFRAPLSVATLSNLTLNNGTISLPSDFNSSTYIYTVNVPNSLTNITLSPTLTDQYATVTVNGMLVNSGTPSSGIPLQVGNNSITTVVTAQDGVTKQTYSLTVNRASSNIATLSNLSSSIGIVTPVFNSGITTGYSVNVPNTTGSINVIPTLSDPTATLTVNGKAAISGVASDQIPLIIGSNIITIIVTAQDGTNQQTYTLTVNRALSTITTLSGLSLSSGNLSPTFNSTTVYYTASVTNQTSIIAVTPIVTDSYATIKVNNILVTSGSTSAPIPLVIGDNTVLIEVTAQDGVTKQTYTLTVTRAKSSQANLFSLAVSSGILSPVFNSNVYSYIDNVPNAAVSISITPTVIDPNATITVNGVAVNNGSSSPSILLVVGANTIPIIVTAQNGIASQTYNLVVNRSPSTDNTLLNLQVNSGTLSPAFDSGNTYYIDNVPNLTSEIVLLPTTSDPSATISINNNTAQSGTTSSPIPLVVGQNNISILVTAQDGGTKTYYLKVTRLQSSVATLSNLVVSNNSLTPGFDNSIFTYRVNVRNSTNSITITPTVTEPNATVTVNGITVTSGSTSSPIALGNIGDNPIAIVITAQDGTTQQYTVTVNRSPSGAAILSNLLVSNGTLSPGFDYGNLSYTDTVTNQTNSITITPTTNEATSTVKVNGVLVNSGTSCSPITLLAGNNTITLVVTAQDGITKQTYNLTVNRLQSAVSTLSNLTVSSGSLAPVFNSATLAYQDNIPNSISVISVTPTATDATASVSVNGTVVPSGTASTPIPLLVGNNAISMVVTAQDNSTKKYSLTVNRSPSGAAILSNLSISSGALNPIFDSGTLTYNINVPSLTSNISVTPTVNDENSTVTVNGMLVTSGTASVATPLVTGKNVFTIVVTAQDGTTKQTYTVMVYRAPSGAANLSDLMVSDGTLSPFFDNSGKNTTYTVNVAFAIGNITLTPSVDDPNSSITVNGIKVTSGTSTDPIPLNEGSNTIKIVVTAQNGITSQTYTLTVYRASSSSVASLNNLTVSVGSLTPVFAPGILAYTNFVPNNSTSITLTPTTTVANAIITVNGNVVASGKTSTAIPLSIGVNIINVVVTSGDGNTKQIYTVTVNRNVPSTEALLKDLIINGATLTTPFNTGNNNYTAILLNNDNTIPSIEVTPTATDNNATVTVNGQISTSTQSTVVINAGQNIIPIVVTAADGLHTNTYNILINKLPTLVGLTVLNNLVNGNNNVFLNPNFVANATSYTATVSSLATAITITPSFIGTVNQALVNNKSLSSGEQSDPITINPGTNLIPIQLTTVDGKQTNTYKLTISRSASNVATLNNLVVSNGTLSPAFNPSTSNYTVEVGYSVNNLTITPTQTGPNATITINNTTIQSGSATNSILLNVGANAITTIVTAEDGKTVKTYTLLVNRQKGSQTVTFAPPVFVRGQAFDLSTISSNSNLPLKFTTLDSSIAQVISGKLIPKEIGKTTLVITQEGNESYNSYSFSVDITVQDGANNEIIVHQFVSPNGDNINDYLLIEGIQEFTNNSVKIINRNGIPVYSVIGYDNEKVKFDGHSNSNGSEYLPAGTYFYVIDYTNNAGLHRQKTGFFLLKY